MATADEAAALAEWKRFFLEKVAAGYRGDEIHHSLWLSGDPGSQFITGEKHNNIKELGCFGQWQ